MFTFAFWACLTFFIKEKNLRKTRGDYFHILDARIQGQKKDRNLPIVMSVLNSVRISSLVSFQYVKSAFLSEYRGPWPRKIIKIFVNNKN